MDVGLVPEGKEEDSKTVRPAIPGAWYGGERFVIMFTCSKCGTRTARTVSKVRLPALVVFASCKCARGNLSRLFASLRLRLPDIWCNPQISYNKGVVLIRCPGCEALHLMADRLGWFADEGKTTDVVQMMKERGEQVRAISSLNARLDTDVESADEVPAAAAGEAGTAPPSQATPLDLALMEGVLDLTEEDIQVLQAQGSFIKPKAGAEEESALPRKG